MGRKHNKHQKKFDNRKLDNTLEGKLEGFERLRFPNIPNDTCGYLRLPHSNGKGVVQGYCSLKESNCIKYNNEKTYENCNTHKEYFKK